MRKNKLYLLLTFLTLCCSLCTYAGGEAPKIWGNSGTNGNKDKAYKDNWYQETSSSLTIASDLELGSLIKALNEGKTFEGKTVELSKDVDMSKYLWTSTKNPFKGVLNGNGYSVTGLKNGTVSSPWAFIGVVDQGEINKISITGSFIGSQVTGGIVGELINGKLTNSSYSGFLTSTVDTVKLGGLVGVNNGGTISNSFFVGSMLLTSGTVAGNIAGVSTGTISNSYFLPNEQIPVGIGEDTGSSIKVKSLPAEAFTSGEASWLLNQWNGGNSQIWSMNGTLPIYASDVNGAVFAISYMDSLENGGTPVSGPKYAKVGSEVVLTSGIVPGYSCTGFTITGAEVEINNNTFVMPRADLQVAGIYVPFEGPQVTAATTITSSGFTANWEAVTDATDYILTVTLDDGTVIESYDGIAVGQVTSYTVTNLLPVKNYKCYIQTKKGELISQMSQAILVTTLQGSTITYSPKVEEFKIGDNQLLNQTISVNGNYLTSDIHISLSETEFFSVSANTLSKEGGELIINYHATEPGNHETTLTFSTEGATDVTLTLKGSTALGIPMPVIYSTEKYSFSAKWDKILLAEKYLLTLLQENKIVEGYDNVETTECHYDFTKIKAGIAYSLKVSSVRGADTLTSVAVNVVTSADYGKQLNNSGFENWHGTGKDAEPLDWHSFMTQNDGFGLASQARVVHMEKSDVVRTESAGKFSTRIWTKVIIAVKANGTLTCGKINAGSATATDYANHNYTVLEDPDFSESLGGAKPDSLTVWVKYVPKTITDQARVSAIIHDMYKYQDPTNNPEILKHKVADAVLDYNATQDKGWQRLSIPFTYSGPSTSADYILVTFASNKTPGGGSENDEVYIDDMLLVYNPEVKITKLDKTSYLQGGKIIVNYTINGTMSPSNLNAEPNVVTLELSDAQGSFDNPTILTSVTTDYSGTLVGTIPAECPVGKGYRVRIVTTNYPMISPVNPDDIEIFEPGAMAISCSKIEEFDLTNGTTSEQTIKVDGFYMINDINISLDKADQGFSIDKTLMPAEGGDLKITYLPTTVGKNAATVTLTSVGLDKAVTVSLSGISRPAAPLLAEVSNITPSGFTTNWSGVENATDYELTVTPVGGEPIIKSVGVVTSYEVTHLQPTTEYMYSLIAKVGDIHSLPVASEASVTTLSKPVLSADQDSLDFSTVVSGSESAKQILHVTAENLLEDIKVELQGSHFAINQTVISKDAEDKIIEVTYHPTEVSRSHKATLVLSTKYGNDVSIQLVGASVPRPTIALPAEEVTSTSFLAKWEAVEGATYRLTVKKNDEILPGYEDAPVRKGNSVAVQKLDASTHYFYNVKVVINNQVSQASEEIAVLTLSADNIEEISKEPTLSVYPNPVANDLYVIGGDARKLDVYTTDGIYVATYQVLANKVNLGSLPSGIYILLITSENDRVERIRIVKE